MFYLTDKNYIVSLFPSSVMRGGKEKGKKKKRGKEKTGY